MTLQVSWAGLHASYPVSLLPYLAATRDISHTEPELTHDFPSLLDWWHGPGVSLLALIHEKRCAFDTTTM